MYRRMLGLAFLCVLLFRRPTALQAQEFKLFDHTVQVHGFASQGFVYTERQQLADHEHQQRQRWLD